MMSVRRESRLDNLHNPNKRIVILDQTYYNQQMSSLYFELLDPLNDNQYRKYFYQNGKYFQLTKLSSFGSCLYANQIISNSEMYSLVKIDPLFMVLGYLQTASQTQKGKQQIDQILTSLQDRHIEQIGLHLLANDLRLAKAFKQVCTSVHFDFGGGEGGGGGGEGEGEVDTLYRLDEDKLFLWLDKKVKIIEKSFGQHLTHRKKNDQDFKKGTIQICCSQMHAYEVLSEYIPIGLFDNYLTKTTGITSKDLREYNWPLEVVLANEDVQLPQQHVHNNKKLNNKPVKVIQKQEKSLQGQKTLSAFFPTSNKKQ